jgi:K+-sensing histidine kinase KdpD
MMWDAQKQNEFLKDADSEADRLEYLVQDFLTLALIESGKLTLNQRVYSLSELTDSFRSRFQTLALKRELKLSIPPGLPVVYIDKERIVQVLEKLVEYIVRVSASEGPVVIRAGLRGDWLSVTITCEGAYFSEDILNVNFERSLEEDRNASNSPFSPDLDLIFALKIFKTFIGE